MGDVPIYRNTLMENFDFSDSENKKIKKFSRKYEEIDNLLKTRDGLKITDPDYKQVEYRIEKLNNEIVTMQKDDLSSDR